MSLEIGLDFDGTCVTHEYPRVGKDIGAARVLKKYAEKGCKYILNTMRGNMAGDLRDAVSWFADNDVSLYGINVNPTQKSWTASPKVYCHVSIDDAALGCPLKMDLALSDRPFVDWEQVDVMLDALLAGKSLVGYARLVQGE